MNTFRSSFHDVVGRRFQVLVAVLGLLSLFYVGAVNCIAEDKPESTLPRYQLKVGQELHYTSQGSFKYDSNSIDSASDIKFWVTRKNGDGSWRLVVRSAENNNSKEPPGDDAEVTLAYLDLFPDGRYAQNSSLGYRFQPRKVFAQLPSNEQELQDGWESHDDASENTYKYKVSSNDPSASAEFHFRSTEDSPSNKIYLSTREAQIAFDRQRGVVRQVDSAITQKWHINGSGTDQIALKEVVDREPEWIASLDRDVDRYFAAQNEHEALMKKFQRSKPEAGLDFAGSEYLKAIEDIPLLNEAREVFTKTRDNVTNDVVKKAIDAQLKQEESYGKYLLQAAVQQAAVLDKKAADWQTTDLDGKPHRLSDYAGKVVVLDFWYRGCGWCIRAMPQVNQVAVDFAAEPVAVLGMNTDSDIQDAKFVEQQLQLKYPSMHIDQELAPKLYAVSGFPTFVVLDQTGTVRDIHVGYSPILRESLSDSIRTLLKEADASNSTAAGTK